MQATQINIFAPRPADIEASWIIFNAPRPIYGHKDWKGEFKEGVFYAAVNPNDGAYSEMYIKENLLLHAVICNYVTETDIQNWILAFCKAEGVDANDFDADDMRQTYFNMMRSQRIEL
jgi:hypothetical protein